MLIINADDWGRSKSETDAARACYRQGAITAVSAMVFMADSERAAIIAREMGIDAGLHVNFTQAFSTKGNSKLLHEHQLRIARFLNASKYSVLFYHPFLREAFRYVYQSQVDEFIRIYGASPSHIDGHRHMHLCANMVIDRIVPYGQKVRQNFSFFRSEKTFMNRTYRRVIDGWMRRFYRLTDFFFSLKQCCARNSLDRVFALSDSATVELMTHPVNTDEQEILMSDSYQRAVARLQLSSYAGLQ